MRTASKILLATVAIVITYILASGQALPPLVASHFGPSGAANGFMQRTAYLALMIGIAAAVPLLLGFCASLIHLVPPNLINLPNGNYWLADERREDTLNFVQDHGMVLCILVAAFFGVVHGLVVRANQVQPAHFPSSAFVPLPLLFLLAVVVWVGVLIVRFSRRR